MHRGRPVGSVERRPKYALLNPHEAVLRIVTRNGRERGRQARHETITWSRTSDVWVLTFVLLHI
jgi:hypothetical protein